MRSVAVSIYSTPWSTARRQGLRSSQARELGRKTFDSAKKVFDAFPLVGSEAKDIPGALIHISPIPIGDNTEESRGRLRGQLAEMRESINGDIPDPRFSCIAVKLPSRSA